MNVIVISVAITLFVFMWFYTIQEAELFDRFQRASAHYGCAISRAQFLLGAKGCYHPEYIAAHDAMMKSAKEFRAACNAHDDWIGF